MFRIRKMSTISAAAVLIAATVAISSIFSSPLSTSFEALAQNNVTQEVASSAN
jgi:hypothetical protein